MIFTITSEHTATVIRLCVTGDIDMSTVGQLDCAISDALNREPSGLLLDLTATTFCDCAGITTLLTGRHDAAAQHVAYQVINSAGACLKILRIFGLHSLLTAQRVMSSVMAGMDE